MDHHDTLAPKSDQLDAADLLGAPPTVFTVTNVSASRRTGRAAAVDVSLAEFPRVWRPGKAMRRVLAACWGDEDGQWAGRRVELYGDPASRSAARQGGRHTISQRSRTSTGPKRC